MSASTPSSSHINWGGVIKGVALVSAVAVAGVVGAYGISAAVGAVSGLIGTTGTASYLAASAVEGAVTLGGWITSAFGTIASTAASAWAAIPSFFGLTSTLATPAVAANASALGSGLGAIAGGATIAVGVHAVTPHIKALALTTPDSTATVDVDADTAILSQVKASTAMHHDFSHATADMAHHASMHGDTNNAQPATRSSWASKFSPMKNAASITPRDPNFSAQLNADRENLRAALGDNSRA